MRKSIITIVILLVVGTVAAVIIAVSIPKIVLQTWIGALVLAIGILILVTIARRAIVKFSWAKVLGLGTLASFNKGMSGGGYGPLVCGGQLLSGIEGKNAVAITSLAEGLTCVAGVVVFLVAREIFPWRLALPLALGALCSVPFSALAVKKVKTKPLTFTIGIVTTILGIAVVVLLLERRVEVELDLSRTFIVQDHTDIPVCQHAVMVLDGLLQQGQGDTVEPTAAVSPPAPAQPGLMLSGFHPRHESEIGAEILGYIFVGGPCLPVPAFPAVRDVDCGAILLRRRRA